MHQDSAKFSQDPDCSCNHGLCLASEVGACDAKAGKVHRVLVRAFEFWHWVVQGLLREGAKAYADFSTCGRSDPP